MRYDLESYTKDTIPKSRVFGETFLRGHAETPTIFSFNNVKAVNTPPIWKFTDHNNDSIPIAQLQRGRGDVVFKPLRAKDNSFELSKLQHAIYVGHIFNHYGHFLLESLSRLWFACCDLPKNTKILLDPMPNTGELYTFPEYQRSLLSQTSFVHFEIAEPKNYIVENLFVPEPAIRVRYAAYKYGQSFFSEFFSDRESLKNSPKKVFFSRRKLTKQTKDFLNQDSVENAFKSCGYQIIDPQEYSIDDQISIVRSADEVAGMAGSALHTTVFAKHKKIKYVVAEPRINANFILCDRVCDHEADYIFIDKFCSMPNSGVISIRDEVNEPLKKILLST